MLSIRLMAPKSFPFLAGEHVTFQVGKRSWAAGKGRVFPKEATKKQRAVEVLFGSFMVSELCHLNLYPF